MLLFSFIYLFLCIQKDFDLILLDLLCLMPLSTIFQLFHDDQFLVVEEAGVYFSYIMATSFSGGGSRSTLFQLYHGDQF